MKKTLFLAIPSIALAAYLLRSPIKALWKLYISKKPMAASNWMMAEISNNETLKKIEPMLKKEVESSCQLCYDFVDKAIKTTLGEQYSQLSKFFAKLFAMRFMRLICNVQTYTIGRNRDIAKSLENINKIRGAVFQLINQYIPILLTEVATVVTQMNEESNNLFHGSVEPYLTSILSIIELQTCTYEEIPNEPSKHRAIKILIPLYKIALDNHTEIPVVQKATDEIIDYVFTNYFQSLLLEGVRDDIKYLGVSTVIKPVNQLFNKTNTIMLIAEALHKQLTLGYFTDENSSNSLVKMLEMVLMPPNQSVKAKRVQYLKNLRCFTHYILYHKADFVEDEGMVQDFDSMANLLMKLII